MRVLIVKTSSLGDIIHTFPAVSEALSHFPDLRCDWVVEKAFASLPSWHPAVDRVIVVAFREWRSQIRNTLFSGTWQHFLAELKERQYDFVIDAQGLLKSGFLTSQARGTRCGLDFFSAREPWATLAYHRRFKVGKLDHAVQRVRNLFAQALGYSLSKELPEYGIRDFFAFPEVVQKRVIFLHGTTWATKHWPEAHWLSLARQLCAAGYTPRLPFGNNEEYERALRIATQVNGVEIIPKGGLYQLAWELGRAKAVVGVDTGLMHLSTALKVPNVSIYGATDPARTGTYGSCQWHIVSQFSCAPCLRKRCQFTTTFPPCYLELTADRILGHLLPLLSA